MKEQIQQFNAELQVALDKEQWELISILNQKLQPVLEEVKAAGKLDCPEYQIELRHMQSLYSELMVYCKDRRNYFREQVRQSHYRSQVAEAYKAGEQR